MITIQAHNSFERAGRYRKVVALLRALEDINGGILSDAELADSIPALPPAVKRLVAVKAGVRTPSETTWGVVASFFAERSKRSAA